MSPLQAQFPLSPKKFWKKMASKIAFWAIVFIVCAVGSIFLIAIGNNEQDIALGFSFVLTALALCIIVGLLLYALYIRAYIRHYYYDATDSFVTIRKGVFAPAEIHVMYQKIQDVYVDQDILDRIMGLYDVHLASATVTSGMEAHIDGVNRDAAEGLKTFLLTKIQGGGTAPPANETAGTSPALAMPAPVILSEDVSIKTYPLAGAWFAQQIVTSIFTSLFLTLLIAFYVFAPGKNNTPSVASFFNVSPLLLILLYIIVFCFHIIYAAIWRTSYSFAFLPEYIQMRSGIVARSEVHVPYRAVQDVLVTQSIFERMFGIATVRIQNAAQAQAVGKRVVSSGVNVPGQPLDKANHLAEVTRQITLTKNSAQTGL